MSMIQVVCGQCAAKMQAPERLVGKTVKCPRCGEAIVIKVEQAPRPLPRPAPPTSVTKAPPPPRRVQVDEVEEVDEVELEEVADADIVEYEERPRSRRRPARDNDDYDDRPRRRSQDDYDDLDDEDDYEEDRPRRGKKKSRGRRRGVTSNDRSTAMLLHLLSLVSGFVGPLIVWMMKKEESKFVDHHGRQHLNLFLTLLIVNFAFAIIAVPLVILTFGIGMLLILPLIACISLGSLILVIIAAMKANAGEWYVIPMTIQFFQ